MPGMGQVRINQGGDPNKQVSVGDWVKKQKDLRAKEDAARQPTGREIFGENIDLPNYDRNQSRDFVISGVAEQFAPQYQSARGEYANRGFGRINAPSVQNALYKPINQQAARSTREALTDLYYKDEQLAMDKGRYQMQRKMFKEQMKGGKVLCTLMWEKGLLPFDHIRADYKYLGMIENNCFHKDYLAWATKLVDRIKDNPRLIKLVFPIVKAWSGYMKAKVEGKRPTVSGAIVHYLGITWGLLYRLIKGRG
jgi:hypothetical protein